MSPKPFNLENLAALLAEVPADSLAAELIRAIEPAATELDAAARLTATVDARLLLEPEHLDAATAGA